MVIMINSMIGGFGWKNLVWLPASTVRLHGLQWWHQFQWEGYNEDSWSCQQSKSCV